jgi:Tfp pilus assembly protein FimT
LMITLALVAVIATFAVPSFQTLIANSRLTSYTNNLVGLLNYARAEAIRTGERVVVSPTIGTSWVNGMSVWVDSDGNGSMSASEELRRISSAGGTITASSLDTEGSSVGSLVFTGGGSMITNTSVNDRRGLVLSVCDSRASEDGTEITVTILGRIRGVDFTCN